jgi:uncharacterized protein YaaQ
MEGPSIKLLLFAVVQEQDQDAATRSIEQLHLPVVHLASAGGFLGRRNTTLLVGLPEDRAGDVIKCLEESSRQRIEYLTLPFEGLHPPILTPVPVVVSGAAIFVLPVEHFEVI